MGIYRSHEYMKFSIKTTENANNDIQKIHDFIEICLQEEIKREIEEIELKEKEEPILPESGPAPYLMAIN